MFSVVKSHAVYAPVCQRLIARSSVAAVTSHLLLDVESFRNPPELPRRIPLVPEHCSLPNEVKSDRSVPNELVAYADTSTIIVFKYASAATQST